MVRARPPPYTVREFGPLAGFEGECMPSVEIAGHHRVWHLGLGIGVSILVVLLAAVAGVWYFLIRSPST